VQLGRLVAVLSAAVVTLTGCGLGEPAYDEVSTKSAERTLWPWEISPPGPTRPLPPGGVDAQHLVPEPTEAAEELAGLGPIWTPVPQPTPEPGEPSPADSIWQPRPRDPGAGGTGKSTGAAKPAPSATPTAKPTRTPTPRPSPTTSPSGTPTPTPCPTGDSSPEPCAEPTDTDCDEGAEDCPPCEAPYGEDACTEPTSH
jgi:hypothetical protein